MKIKTSIIIMTVLICSMMSLSFLIKKPSNISTNTLEDSYVIVSENSNFIQTIAYKLLQPIIKSRIDYYIEINGLKDHLEKIKKKIQQKKTFNIHILNNGIDKKVTCGDEVSVVLYKIDISQPFNSHNIYSTIENMNNLTTFILGNHSIKELNYGIDGMFEGEERIITILNNKTDKFISYYVKLSTIKRKIISQDDIENLLIFDNVLDDTMIQMRCGDIVSIKYNLREYNGSLILKDQLLKFKIGEGKVPLAIELGVLNMSIGNTRSIIVPANLIKNLHNKENYNKNSIKIVDISTISEETSTYEGGA